MNIQPLILSGGSGTRLWPLSRENGFYDDDFYLHLAVEIKPDLIILGMGMPKQERVAYVMQSAAYAHARGRVDVPVGPRAEAIVQPIHGRQPVFFVRGAGMVDS